MLRELNQTEKDKYCAISVRGGIKKQNNKKPKPGS